MNKHMTEFAEVMLVLPREVDEEVAGDIEKESVFVSPGIERIRVNADRKSARIFVRPGASPDDVTAKAQRYLDVMAKQLSGFEIKVFIETERKDKGPYQTNVNEGLVNVAGCMIMARARLPIPVRF